VNDVFISIPFEERFGAVFDTIKTAAGRQSLNAVRIDRARVVGPVSVAVHRKIRDARLVLADVTGANPNVLNEVGLAEAFGKPLILITQDQPEDAPFNIRNLQLHKYASDNLGGLLGRLDRAFSEATSPSEVLRAMLVPSTLGQPTRESWFVIAASPLSFRRASGRHGGYKKLRRTSSDYVGIRGIMQSFGLLFGFDVLPDNLDPEDCDDSVLHEPMNLYCIASPKANRWTASLLNEYGTRWAPRLGFAADPAGPDLRNVALSILCDGEAVRPPGWSANAQGDRYHRDFGIVVRGPNPYHEECMAAVIAGRSSLGTEAACAAFTDPDAIAVIRQRLAAQNIDLEDHKQPFWTLVSMRRALGDDKEEAVRGSLNIERVESFVRK